MEVNYLNEIKAVEGWALQCYQESLKKTPNIDVIVENLRKINLEARKIERGMMTWLKRDQSLIDNYTKKLSDAKKEVEKALLKRYIPVGDRVDDEERRRQKEQDWGVDSYEKKLGYMKKQRIVAKRVLERITQLRATVITVRAIKKDKGLNNSSKQVIWMLSSLSAEARKEIDYHGDFI